MELFDAPAFFLGVRGIQEARVRHNEDLSHVEVEPLGKIKLPILSFFNKKETIIHKNIRDKVRVDVKTYETTGEAALFFWCDIYGEPYVGSADGQVYEGMVAHIKTLTAQRNAHQMRASSLTRDLMDEKSDSHLRARMLEDGDHAREMREKYQFFLDSSAGQDKLREMRGGK